MLLNVAAVVFAIAALGGIVLAAHVLRGKLAPWALSLLHAALGAAGIVLVLVTVIMLFVGVFVGVFVGRPGELGILLVLVAAGLAALVLGLVSPSVALVYLLLTTFFRLSITSGPLPLDPFMFAFGLLVLTVAVRLFRGRDRYALIGPLEVAMVLYVAVNVLSMFTTHRYAATYPLDDTPIEVSRFFVIGVAIPLACVVVGIASFGHERGMRVIVLAVMAFAAYSAFGSIMTFHGPQALVFPRFMVTDPGWSGRAVGVFRQPVANGLTLILGYLCAVLMASRRSEPRWLRLVSALLAVATLYGVYLTHTRGVWLALGVVVLLGGLLARGWRRGFVATGVLVTSAIAANWTEFTSSDRSGGGVGSASELEDRLNMIATAAWAIEREPWFGWGLGRFAAVNTLHHQQATPSVPWERGYAISSHLDILGITTELGLLGGACYLLLLGVLAFELLRAAHVLQLWSTFAGQVAVLAVLFFACWMVIGLTVDLRFFDFPNIAVMTLIGAVIGCARRTPRIAV